MKLASVVAVCACLSACLGACLGACGDNDGDGGTPPPASCVPGCAGVRTYDALAYDLHASFDWGTLTLTASEDIALATGSSGPIVQLDAAVHVSRVHAGSQDLAFTQDGSADTLTIDTTPAGSDSGSAAFTVEYTAQVDGSEGQTSGTALLATTSTANDPVQSRVVFTDSEPNRALYWLVCKVDPSDRALWSVDVTVGSDEDVVANGARLSDTATADGKRTVAYALDKPIPPYLMAFAAGELEHTDRPAAGGVVPLSVWYRRGMVLDPNLTLDDVTTAMQVFNALIMPYPWDTYSVVLLPYGGGMENATITFNDEESGQGAGDFVLNAHELSHHWFGDWVTMNTYDDVWFKEGMATVLESEAERAVRDAEDRGRLWGTDYAFNAQDAIVDDTLHGLDKYTSGPYERAGWLITQIRAKVGETAFFAGLRAMLAAHALGSVTGEQFIRSFQPALDEATVQQLLAELPQTALPALAVTTVDVGSGSAAATNVTLALTDPGAEIIEPMDISVIDATGSATTMLLAPGSDAALTVPAGGYLAVDERDVHPPWYEDFGVGIDTYFAVGSAFAPPPTAAAGAVAAFASRSAAQQEKAEQVRLLPIASSSQLAAYIASLDSDDAQVDAVVSACLRAQASGDSSWLTAAEPFLETPPRSEFDEAFAACGTAYPKATLEPELTAAIASGTVADLARIEYLISFDYGTDSQTVIGPLVTSAPTLRLREIAQERLADQASGQHGYSLRARRGPRRDRVKKTHLRAAHAPAHAPWP
jgi:hypothetical protein